MILSSIIMMAVQDHPGVSAQASGNAQSRDSVDYLKNALDDIEFHFHRRPEFSQNEYKKLVDCLTDNGQDMLLFLAQQQSWKAMLDVWENYGLYVDDNKNVIVFGQDDTYREAKLGGTYIGRYGIKIMEPCNYASSLAYYKTAMQICHFSNEGKWHISKQTQRDLVRAVASLAVGSSLYHGMSNGLGARYDQTMISFIGYISNQIVLNNYPNLSSVLWEFSFEPRNKSATETLDDIIRSLAFDDINIWYRDLQQGDINYRYDMVAWSAISALVALSAPTWITQWFFSFAESIMIDENDRNFMRNNYFPNLLKAASSIEIPFAEQVRIYIKFLGASAYLWYAYQFTENRSQFFNFNDGITLAFASFILPSFSTISHFISGNIFEWDLATPSTELYPGIEQCRRSQPHSVWHEGSAQALFDMIYLCDYVYQVLASTYTDLKNVDVNVRV